MLNGSSAPSGDVAAHTMCSARIPASVMSVRPFHCASLPGNTKSRSSSFASVACTAIVRPMFMALPTAWPITVCERCTDQVNPWRSAAATSSSSWA